MAYSAIIFVQYLDVSYSFSMQYPSLVIITVLFNNWLRFTEFHVEIISDHMIVEWLVLIKVRPFPIYMYAEGLL